MLLSSRHRSGLDRHLDHYMIGGYWKCCSLLQCMSVLHPLPHPRLLIFCSFRGFFYIPSRNYLKPPLIKRPSPRLFDTRVEHLLQVKRWNLWVEPDMKKHSANIVDTKDRGSFIDLSIQHYNSMTYKLRKIYQLKNKRNPIIRVYGRCKIE